MASAFSFKEVAFVIQSATLALYARTRESEKKMNSEPKKKDTTFGFRPDDDVMELLNQAQSATRRDRTAIINGTLRMGLKDWVSAQLVEQRAHLDGMLSSSNVVPKKASAILDPGFSPTAESKSSPKRGPREAGRSNG